jgi:hypothetical protein
MERRRRRNPKIKSDDGVVVVTLAYPDWPGSILYLGIAEVRNVHDTQQII